MFKFDTLDFLATVLAQTYSYAIEQGDLDTAYECVSILTACEGRSSLPKDWTPSAMQRNILWDVTLSYQEEYDAIISDPESTDDDLAALEETRAYIVDLRRGLLALAY